MGRGHRTPRNQARQRTGYRFGVLSYPGAQQASTLGLLDLLSVAGRLALESDASLPSLAVDHLDAKALGARHKTLDVLILPPSLDAPQVVKGTSGLEPALQLQHRRGAVLCSVCAGAFLLAQAGLLNGRPATTHWGLRDTFEDRFPEVVLDTQRILIDDGDVITAGGMMAWIDLSLHLISRFISPSVMLQVARYFVVDPGGREQRFYETFAPVLNHGDAAVLTLQHWLPKQLERNISLDEMATKAKLSPRTLLRRFQRATGSTPGEYLQRLRTERARGLLETSDRGIDEVAWRVGYEDVGAFRRIFVRLMGLTPGEYRRRFRAR